MKRTHAGSDDWFDVVLGTDDAQAAVMTLAPGDSTGGPENRHENAEQWLYVVSGTGRATVDADTLALEEGDLVVIEVGETHEIEASESESLRTLSVYVPPVY